MKKSRDALSEHSAFANIFDNMPRERHN